MSCSRSCCAFALLAAIGLVTTSQAYAAEQREWEPVLRQQVKSARACDLKTILYANTMELGKQRILEGRLSCSDGREFTFTRKHEHQKFEFELCEPAVC